MNMPINEVLEHLSVIAGHDVSAETQPRDIHDAKMEAMGIAIEAVETLAKIRELMATPTNDIKGVVDEAVEAFVAYLKREKPELVELEWFTKREPIVRACIALDGTPNTHAWAALMQWEKENRKP